MTTQESKIPQPAYAPFTKNHASAPAYWSDGILWVMLATGQETAGTFAVMEQFCAQEVGPPLPLHMTTPGLSVHYDEQVPQSSVLFRINPFINNRLRS